MGWNDVEREPGQSADKVPYAKFENGNNLIRILDKEPYSFWQHWLPQQKTSVSCMGKDCPICNIIHQQKQNNETPKYNSTQRHAIRIYNYTTKKMEVLIQGRTFFGQLLDLHKEVGDLTTYDLKIIRKGSGTDTTYTMIPAAPSEFKFWDDCSEVNIPELLKAPTKEQMLQLMEGKTWAEINGAEEIAA